MKLESMTVVALGSNLGDSRELIQRAFGRLADMAGDSFRESSIWRSEPVDCPPGSPPFMNAIVVFAAAEPETPESLLKRLQAIEVEFGRQPKVVLNEPRPLDLDIVSFAQEIRNTSDLVIPHPRAGVRRFVLAPLAEIVPGYRAPGWLGTAAELLARMGPDNSVSPI